MVKNLLHAANTWLQNQTDSEVSYAAFIELLDYSGQVRKHKAAQTH